MTTPQVVESPSVIKFSDNFWVRLSSFSFLYIILLCTDIYKTIGKRR